MIKRTQRVSFIDTNDFTEIIWSSISVLFPIEIMNVNLDVSCINKSLKEENIDLQNLIKICRLILDLKIPENEIWNWFFRLGKK
ncbi:MAG: hypothetical protein Ta2E_00150 [Mycoplasmoidaceae bacterium]|nr:MAG: hypothetical protein Ta2E_00150 [Mycoplasmoidaceae bacterium]